jgi:hypothetical protein
VSTTLADEETTPLTAADRCDACGARAYVRIELPYGQLLFCGHHANEHLDKLKDQAIRIWDERPTING